MTVWFRWRGLMGGSTTQGNSTIKRFEIILCIKYQINHWFFFQVVSSIDDHYPVQQRPDQGLVSHLAVPLWWQNDNICWTPSVIPQCWPRCSALQRPWMASRLWTDDHPSTVQGQSEKKQRERSMKKTNKHSDTFEAADWLRRSAQLLPHIFDVNHGVFGNVNKEQFLSENVPVEAQGEVSFGAGSQPVQLEIHNGQEKDEQTHLAAMRLPKETLTGTHNGCQSVRLQSL